MAKNMIVQMVTCQRYMYGETLFRRDNRAYKVQQSYGLDLLDLLEGDRPVFKQTRKDRLADDTVIIDLTGGGTDEGEDETEYEVSGKAIRTKSKTGKSRDDKKKKVKTIKAGKPRQGRTVGKEVVDPTPAKEPDVEEV